MLSQPHHFIFKHRKALVLSNREPPTPSSLLRLPQFFFSYCILFPGPLQYLIRSRFLNMARKFFVGGNFKM